MPIILAAALAFLGLPGAAGPQAAAGCLVRFSAIVDGKGIAFSNPQGSVVSPVYVLAARDCPAMASPVDEYSASWMDGPMVARAGMPGLEGKTPRHAAGKTMVTAFATWLKARTINAQVGSIRGVGTMIVQPVTPFNRERYVKDVGAKTYFVEKPGPGGAKQIVAANEKWAPVRGVCLDYAPAGIVPVEVLGRENCTGWIR